MAKTTATRSDLDERRLTMAAPQGPLVALKRAEKLLAGLTGATAGTASGRSRDGPGPGVR